jgi:hypothetical protein
MVDQPRTDPSTAHQYVDVRRLSGRVTPGDMADADLAMASLLDEVQADVSDVRIRLAGASCGIGPGLVQINLTVNGLPARVQVSGRSVGDAVAAALERLEWKVQLLVPVQSAELAAWPDPQHRRPLAIALPAQITRPKSVPLETTTPVAASRVLVAMDYNAHLFIDEATGEEAIIYRGGPSGLRLTRQRSMRPQPDHTIPTIVVHPQRPPTMSPAEAVDWLVTYHLPQVFFTDAESHRGFLLYRRYDGNLAIVTPGPHQM